jgi:hypothetical protein
VGNRLLGAIFIGFLLSGCVEGHCRRQVDPPPPAQPVSDQGVGTQNAGDPNAHVFIYKYDGSLQCKSKAGKSPQAMAKELTGIRIFSSEKKSDGLMHIQVCGSITGKANVYEIEAKNLKAAQARGFKKWSFE